jgi:hypothetical protein
VSCPLVEPPVVPLRETAFHQTARKVLDSAALRQDDRVGYSAGALILVGAFTGIPSPPPFFASTAHAQQVPVIDDRPSGKGLLGERPRQQTAGSSEHRRELHT